MKVLVGVKRVIDASVVVRVKRDGSGVDLDGVKMATNPFDEIALEEAIRLRERGIATEILAVSIGTPKAEETLRAALAMGADRALLIETENRVEPLAVAKLLKAVALAEGVELALLGRQAIDDDAAQTGPMLAALLDWPQATFAAGLEFVGPVVRVEREIDAGIQVMELRLPAVITVDLRLNTPRFAPLPKIMAARKRPIERQTPAALGVDLAPRLAVLRTEEPAGRQAGERLSSAAELVARLRERGLVEP
ncbi:MAG TPA: electron transfer flavoprotein subunit beta/FixA family protein [Devosiaceae bacterium]|nr:electron transfer flavoprotein subunit beta/FixA family protein [Devosiaceae bacterium]